MHETRTWFEVTRYGVAKSFPTEDAARRWVRSLHWGTRQPKLERVTVTTEREEVPLQ